MTGTNWLQRRAVFLTLVTLACRSASGQSPTPDAVYYNGHVVTVDKNFSIAEAIAVTDGRISAVGTNDEVRRAAGPDTRQVDLHGKTVLPGFYDNHVHLGGEILQEWHGGLISGVPEWIRGAATMEKLTAALRKKAAETPAGEWIVGGLTREEWPNQRLPTRYDLDKAVPDHPLVLTRGPHTLVLNSMALRKAGITKATKDPPGGWLVRDKNGEPLGPVLEAARRLVEPVMPERRPRPADPVETWRRQLRRLEALGITSVNVAGVRPSDFRVLQDLYARYGDELPRMTAQLRLSPGFDTYNDPKEGVKAAIREMESLGFHTGFGNDRLKVGAIKMSIDGGLSAPVMWTSQPYATRPGFSGVVRIPAETFYQVARRAHELGWQVGTHAIGDAATTMVVEQLERILKEEPRPDARHYIHHIAVKPSDEILTKMGKLGILAAVQPAWTTNLGAYAAEALAGERLETQNPGRSLLDHGIKVSYGSDGLPYGPLVHIWDAVTRRGWDGKVYGPQEAVTVQEAIYNQTMGSAYLTFDEKVKGSIEPGKLADFVVLGEDILTVDPMKIRDIPVELTIIGGREVYSAADSARTAN
ncbi:MAG: amidohydrolase [Gemmatimonadetes bacterium]|nr:amidohydrolase [Gemmatimonadota bacterium]